MPDDPQRQRLQQILVAAVPLLAQPPALPPLLQTAMQASLFAYLSDPADYERIMGLMQVCEGNTQPPRPAQGGQRITEEWLNTLDERDCLWWFRMPAPEIYDMVGALGIPLSKKTPTRYIFDRVEAFCLLLARYRSAGDMYTLSMLYDRSQSAISEIVNALVELIDSEWEHLLDCDSEHLLRPSELSRFAHAIHAHGAPIKSVFGFIDCTIRRICRPTWWQQQAYNDHKKIHALKYQALMLPNGIIGHLYGPFEGRRNDNFLLTESGLLDRLAQFAHPEDVDEDTPFEERTFQIFGDPAYGVGPHILSPFSGAGERTPEEQEWNAQMSAVRIEVEHGFGIVSNT
ncbi:putative DDE superfamily endonuclease [Lyophyllum shimeji]|uniref:DDE superfamily endonuclease n=1 Tax=Lyophyllum shimeji TaxID=47721 RepID=A0A9P3PYE4_LYOSH|nr:putative DDE superfamily endonuclease [Lyophyllum shimeji]